MKRWTFVKFDAGRYAVVVLLGLGAILVLPLARMPLLKLYWRRATSVLNLRIRNICNGIAMGFAAEGYRFLRWKLSFVCLRRLTAKESWKKAALAWNIKIWCAWDSRLCFANICKHLYPKMNGSRKCLFSVRSLDFANTANTTGSRVKQLQHVSDRQTCVVSSWR